MAHPEALLTPKRAAALETLVVRLESGEPLPYVLGSWEFFGLEFEVTPDVLIPRPETELLVERAIVWLQAHPDRRHAADVGTGSGCIGIALAANVPDLQVMATDISSAAVEMARRNAVKNGVGRRMEFLCCDLFPPEVEFDLIVANLPYIPTKTLHKLPIYGREPTMALDGGVRWAATDPPLADCRSRPAGSRRVVADGDRSIRGSGGAFSGVRCLCRSRNPSAQGSGRPRPDTGNTDMKTEILLAQDPETLARALAVLQEWRAGGVPDRYCLWSWCVGF